MLTVSGLARFFIHYLYPPSNIWSGISATTNFGFLIFMQSHNRQIKIGLLMWDFVFWTRFTKVWTWTV
jgi:hypothetical protein